MGTLPCRATNAFTKKWAKPCIPIFLVNMAAEASFEGGWGGAVAPPPKEKEKRKKERKKKKKREKKKKKKERREL